MDEGGRRRERTTAVGAGRARSTLDHQDWRFWQITAQPGQQTYLLLGCPLARHRSPARTAFLP